MPPQATTPALTLLTGHCGWINLNSALRSVKKRQKEIFLTVRVGGSLRVCLSVSGDARATLPRGLVHEKFFDIEDINDHSKWKDLVFMIRKTRLSSRRASLLTAAAVSLT